MTFSILRNPFCNSMRITGFSSSSALNEDLTFFISRPLSILKNSLAEKLDFSWKLVSFPTPVALLLFMTELCIRTLPFETAKQDRKEFFKTFNLWIVIFCFSNQTSITSLEIMFIVIFVLLIIDASPPPIQVKTLRVVTKINDLFTVLFSKLHDCINKLLAPTATSTLLLLSFVFLKETCLWETIMNPALLKLIIVSKISMRYRPSFLTRAVSQVFSENKVSTIVKNPTVEEYLFWLCTSTIWTQLVVFFIKEFFISTLQSLQPKSVL